MPITQIPAWIVYLIAFSQLALAIALLIISFSLLPLIKSLIEVSNSCAQVAKESQEVVRNSNNTISAFTRKVEEADPRDMATLAQELGKIERAAPKAADATIDIEEARGQNTVATEKKS